MKFEDAPLSTARRVLNTSRAWGWREGTGWLGRRGVWGVALCCKVLRRCDGCGIKNLNQMKTMTTESAAYRPAVRLVLAVACLLMVPLLAMQVSDDVKWTPFDFAAAGTMLLGAGLTYQLV